MACSSAGLAVSALAGAAEALLPGQPELLRDLADSLTALASWISLTLALALLPIPHASPSAVAVAVGTSCRLHNGGPPHHRNRRNQLVSPPIRRASIAGAFGAVLVKLTWIYYEAQILLGGVQLAKILVTARPDEFVASEPPQPTGQGRTGADG